GVQPAFATVEPETIDADYYDVNVEFCGLGKNHSVQLTQQQLDELELIFETLREQLNNTESKEETIQIYNNAIESLNDLGLFGDCSIEEVKQLVNSEFQNLRINRLTEILKNYYQDINCNLFCYIAGETTDSFFFPKSSISLMRFLLLLDLFIVPFLPRELMILIAVIFLCTMVPYNTIREIMTFYVPISLSHAIGFGGYYGEIYKGSAAANGWVHTFGLFGKKDWNGSFYGQMTYVATFFLASYIGAVGFKGIKIKMDSSPLEIVFYYLGFANYVNIDYEPPWWVV
ncbi:MAG: hypothetical protein JSU91_04870, partial [Thermoplasmatales archaeon]